MRGSASSTATDLPTGSPTINIFFKPSWPPKKLLVLRKPFPFVHVNGFANCLLPIPFCFSLSRTPPGRLDRLPRFFLQQLFLLFCRTSAIVALLMMYARFRVPHDVWRQDYATARFEISGLSKFFDRVLKPIWGYQASNRTTTAFSYTSFSAPSAPFNCLCQPRSHHWNRTF